MKAKIVEYNLPYEEDLTKPIINWSNRQIRMGPIVYEINTIGEGHISFDDIFGNDGMKFHKTAGIWIFRGGGNRWVRLSHIQRASMLLDDIVEHIKKGEV